MKNKKPDLAFSCPTPIRRYESVLLAHGGGGSLMHQLIKDVIAPVFKDAAYNPDTDSAVLTLPGNRIAMTTDSYVVQPLFFPGGNIGDLAVNGTVNDLAMVGARPLYLTLGLIIEEGLPMATLTAVLQSIKMAALKAGVKIVTGDTKVVNKGKGDGLFVNTAGVGIVEHKLAVQPSSVREGDVILLNGDIGRHGIAIMAEREGLAFESPVVSDTAPVASLVMTLLEKGFTPHCLRDLTRGGLASALNEIAESAACSIEIEENAIPVDASVHAACEMLGFDPLYVANEGRFIAFLPANEAEKALALLRQHPDGADTRIIGRVLPDKNPLVTMKNKIGTRRVVDMLSGEQLPRIC